MPQRIVFFAGIVYDVNYHPSRNVDAARAGCSLAKGFISYANADKQGKGLFMNCNICPRNCSVDRTGQAGYCGVVDSTADSGSFLIARAALHMWEEPCISGSRGSGAVFFGGCNLRCIYCQNHEIAIGHTGIYILADRLSEAILRLQEQGANNINLVTPSHYIPKLVPVLEKLRRDSLTIPVVCNTSAYDSVDTLKQLDGLVDVYLPDYKYSSSALAARYSNAPDYPSIAQNAIVEMLRQVGSPRFQKQYEDGSYSSPFTSEAGSMVSGVIIRHLVLPGHTEESKQALSLLYHTFGDRVYISIMNQYTPCRSNLPDQLNRTLTPEEYDEVVSYAEAIGIQYGFIQEGETAKESFIPPFSKLEGI